MTGPDNSYTFQGHGQIIAGLSGANTLKASKQGKHIIQFRNGDIVEYIAPNMKISGLIFGQRNVNFDGSFEVNDKTNKIVARITFEESKSVLNQMKEKMGWFRKPGPSLPSLPTDFFQIKILRYSDENDITEEITQGIGSWLDNIQFNNNTLWHMGMIPEKLWVVSEERLPSDSIYREDLQYLLQSDIERAQIAKDNLENIQRKDKSLRTII